MIAIIEEKGFTFEVDLQDWSNEEGAEYCLYAISSWLMDRTESEVRLISEHFGRGIYEEPTAIAAECEAEVGKIWLKATEGWHRVPDSGHNFIIRAANPT